MLLQYNVGQRVIYSSCMLCFMVTMIIVIVDNYGAKYWQIYSHNNQSICLCDSKLCFECIFDDEVLVAEMISLILVLVIGIYDIFVHKGQKFHNQWPFGNCRLLHELSY